MAQISQVANDQVVHMDDVDRVAPMFLPALRIVVRGDAGDQHITDLVLTRPAHNTRTTADGGGIVVAWMVVTDGNNGGVDLAQQAECISRGRTLLRRERVGDYCRILATQYKAGVAQPRDFHS